jgi:cyclophilin family peptidyl-prolyl cis-trans isomerase
MKSKIIYLLAAIIAVAAILLVLNKAFNKTAKAPEKSSSESTAEQDKKIQESQQNQQAALKPLEGITINGCPNGQDLTKTAAGKFVANVDIKNKVVVMDTTKGRITIELYDQDAPKTVENFVCLVAKGYYDGINFHRIAQNFVIQAGDPTGTGGGGESIYGKEFEDELNPNTASYKTGYVKGVLAMANRGANTNTSQFFITLNDVNSNLRKNYTIFGKVIEGMDVVEKIGAIGTYPPGDGAPLEKVTITKAVVNEKE